MINEMTRFAKDLYFDLYFDSCSSYKGNLYSGYLLLASYPLVSRKEPE